MTSFSPARGPETDAERAQQFEGQVELLAQMGRDFASSMDLGMALLRAVDLITATVEAEGGALFLLDETGEKLTCHASVGATEIDGLVLESDRGIVGRCVQGNIGEIVRDVRNDPSFYGGVDEETGYTTRSVLCAPLSVKDQRIGAVELINKRGGDGLFSADDLHLLEAMSTSAALAILNARQAEALVEQERVRRELELAREIQRSLLPRETEEGFPVLGINRPAREVSGDFYDYFALRDGRICFAVGDVSGKGMNAALLMAKTASLYRCLGKATLSPGRLLAQLNREICETSTRGMFVTMIAGVYDPRFGSVVLANAGHEPPLLHHADGRIEAFEAVAPPLGILPDPPTPHGFPETQLNLDLGTFWVFTDGLTEGLTAEGAELERAGVERLLARVRRKPVETRFAALVDAIVPQDTGLRDDITVLAVDDGIGREVHHETLDGPSEPTSLAPTISAAGGGETVHLVSLNVPTAPDKLRLIRKVVGIAAGQAGCGEKEAGDVVLAVDEACQNIIRHASGGCYDGEIGLEISAAGGELVISLTDCAAPVDVDKIKPRDLDDVRPGGLGTHIIQEVMDQVSFLTPPAGVGNLLQLKKRIG